ncbi:MAG: helix-turn-helix domain-containing protein [Tenericutes bacterium]|nr:helix-turn-helix domain-containing protein [Mycoplasmatota bacterium]
MENTGIFKEEKELYTIIGKNIRYYRKLYSLNKKEMTQEALAELANVSTSLIGNLESKKTTQGISIYNLYKISKILNVPIEYFFIDR